MCLSMCLPLSRHRVCKEFDALLVAEEEDRRCGCAELAHDDDNLGPESPAAMSDREFSGLHQGHSATALLGDSGANLHRPVPESPASLKFPFNSTKNG